MYGLTEEIKEQAKRKIKKQEIYLTTHCFSKGTNNIRMIDVVKTPIFNSKRYVSEVNHRVYNLHEYAISKNLKNIFGTITLPSEYHKFKTLKNKKVIPNPKYNNLTPNDGARELSKMFKQLLDLRIYRDIDKSDKCYFRVYEPHKDGTPHLHFSMFVPENKINETIEKFKQYINDNYQDLQVKFETNIKNPVSYLMKYILKTFDDLRKENSTITDLSLWYVANNITRFYTSRTLISLDIYRKLNGKYTLLQLTRMYKDREISVFIDPETKKVCSIYDSIAEIWKKPNYTVLQVTDKTKFAQRIITVPEITRVSYCDITDIEYTNNDGKSVLNQKIDFYYDEIRNIKNIAFLDEYGFSA